MGRDWTTPGEGYKFPETRSPESPRVEQFPTAYDWPTSPINVCRQKRFRAMERWLMAGLGLKPDHSGYQDCKDIHRANSENSSSIELKSALVSVEDGSGGEFKLMRKQFMWSSWISWVFLSRDQWEVLWWGLAPMDILGPIDHAEWVRINEDGDLGKNVTWRDLLAEVDDFEEPAKLDRRVGIQDYK